VQQWNRVTPGWVSSLRIRLVLPLVMAFTVAGSAAGGSVTMIQVTDLRAESLLAKEKDLVLVIEFAAEDCGYCRKLEDLFLLPMQRNTEYGDKILLRMVSLSEFDSLIDFHGRSVTTAEFAAQYDVSLTPTLVFLNADGVEMSEKLVGIWSEDFFGGFIDNRIDEARDRL
jgi:thioredoxin-related protein